MVYNMKTEKTKHRLNKPLIKTVFNRRGKLCPDCQSGNFYNFNNIYIVCSRCGLIVESREPTTKGAGYYQGKPTKETKDHKTNFYKKYEIL